MPSKPPQYRLVIFDAIDDPKELRDLFQKATGMHPTDAVQWLGRAPGTWPALLDERATRRLLDGLYDFGIAAEAWRADQFPDLGTPRTIHRAACLEGGLRIEGLRGEPTHWVPWNLVELICAGRVVGEDESKSAGRVHWPSSLVAGARALTLRKPKPIELANRARSSGAEPVREVLVARREPRVTFRFVENQMNYAYLGDRIHDVASGNFPIFLADLCARADHAYLTESTRSLLEHRDPGEHDFSTSRAILDHASLQLLWSWYRRDREAQNREIRERPTGTDFDMEVFD